MTDTSIPEQVLGHFSNNQYFCQPRKYAVACEADLDSVIMALVAIFFAVVAGAGVFGTFAGRAVGEVQVKLLRDCFGIRSHLDLEDDRQPLAFGDGRSPVRYR